MPRLLKLAAPAAFLLFAACGGGSDPTPDAEDSASAAAINVSVERAEDGANMQQAAVNATGEANTIIPANIGETADEAPGPLAPASGERPAQVDSSAGDPLPSQR